MYIYTYFVVVVVVVVVETMMYNDINVQEVKEGVS